MVDADKFKKALLKKLRQVEALKERAKKGEPLDAAQLERVAGEAKLREALGDDAPESEVQVSEADIAASAAAKQAQIEQELKDRPLKKPKKEKKSEDTLEDAVAKGPKETVLALLKLKLKPPVHVAALSVAYKSATGKRMRDEYKGGMLSFLKKEMKEDLLLMGEGNDTFVRLGSPSARATHWVRECVQDYGPILVSMLGRMYHTAHGTHFTHDFPQGVSKFLTQHLKDELTFEEQKGNEQLVDLVARGATRYFVPEKKRGDKLAPQAGHVRGRMSQVKDADDIPYQCGDKILVIGDADFSWSAGLATRWGRGGAEGVVATSYESKQKVTAKYPNTRTNLDILHRGGASTNHSVDATQLGLDGTPAGKLGKGFDFVVFNFPHTGSDQGLEASIETNKELLDGFFRTAPKLLGKKKNAAELHITLVNRYPYTAWKSEWVKDGPKLREAGLEYLGAVDFVASCYPGYEHQATSKTGDGALDVQTRCCTHAWRVKEGATSSQGEDSKKSKKKKKAAKAEQEDEEQEEEVEEMGSGQDDNVYDVDEEQDDSPKRKRAKASEKVENADEEGADEKKKRKQGGKR